MEEKELTKEQIQVYNKKRLESATALLKQTMETIYNEYGCEFIPFAQIVDGKIVADVQLRLIN